MKTAVKIAFGYLKSNVKRFILTLIGVILSVGLISLACGISGAVIRLSSEADLDPADYNATVGLFTVLTVISAVMGCLMIYSAFCITFDGRVRMMGLLSSLGMSEGQKCAMVLSETAVYGIFAIPAGVALGTLAARMFFILCADILFGLTDGMVTFRLSAGWILLSAVLGILALFAASFSPMMKLRRISVMDSVHGRTKINISLTPGFLANLTERLFGRMGKLAGQNYDNHKSKYRAISLSLSGGTTFFILLYSFLIYPIRDYRQHSWDIEPELQSLFNLLMGFAVLLVILFLLCASGSASVNMDRRRREFAMLKSIGMKNSELCRMMCVESVFLVYYCAVYGLVGSLIADWAVYSFYLVTSDPMLKFYYPIHVFLLFVVFDFAVGIAFAVYSSARVRRVSIIDTIRGE